MTQIRVDADSSLGQVLRDNRTLAGFITVRDHAGEILWSHSIEEWELKQHGPATEITLQTRDIQDRIETAVANYRLSAEFEYRSKGLL